MSATGMTTTFFFTMFLVSGAASFGEVSVFSKQGNVLLKDSNGAVQMLTTSGRDNFPSLTCDGKRVLFARHDASDEFHTQIYAMDLASRATTLIFAGPVSYHGEQIQYLADPQFDERDRVLYLVARTSVTTGVIFAVDLETKKASEVAEGIGFTLVSRGKHASELVAYQRRLSITDEVYYVHWLYSRTGRDLGIAGPDDMHVSSLSCQAPQPDKEAVTNARTPGSSGVFKAVRPASDALQVDAETMSRRLKVRIAPEYPAEAKAEALKGIVRLQVLVRADGSVADAKLVSGHPTLARAAVAAVRQWKYEPVLRNGRTVEVVTIVDISLP